MVIANGVAPARVRAPSEVPMNNEEAVAVLDEELAKYRGEPYVRLVDRMSAGPAAYELTAPSGTKYQVEVEVFWDDRPGGNVRVMGSIDDGGWRAFRPLCRDFIKAPDGSFVGE